MASNFPKLPGYTPTHTPFDQARVKKISHVHLEKIRNGKDVTVPLYAVPEEPAKNFTQTKADASLSLSHNQFPNHFGADIDEQFEPTYVKLDNMVLKFLAYTKEHVVESRLENYRNRLVEIYYFLVDKSIMITEPKQVDSGVPQGAFFKRKAIQKADGHAYAPCDFGIGCDVAILSRVWTIYDCDQFTRNFYQTQGVDMPPARQAPVDAFATSKVPILPKKDPEMLQYMEKKLGGGKVLSQKQFLDHDRKVLRFYCQEEERNRPFIITYFQADDTVEVLEVHVQNDGYDSFNKLLRRQRLTRNWEVKQPGHAYIGDNYLTCDEIHPCQKVNICGHHLTIIGSDEYTHNYMIGTYGLDFNVGKHPSPAARVTVPSTIPTHTPLMGGEQDSLGYTKRLVPQAPKQDEFKFLDNDKKILRWTAKFNTRIPEDLDRRFIISFYLSDDSLSIYEPEQKNSGIIPGKFLERKKYKSDQVGQEFITPTIISNGNDVTINGHKFHILGCDDYTQWYLNNYYV